MDLLLCYRTRTAPWGLALATLTGHSLSCPLPLPGHPFRSSLWWGRKSMSLWPFLWTFLTNSALALLLIPVQHLNPFISFRLLTWIISLIPSQEPFILSNKQNIAKDFPALSACFRAGRWAYIQNFKPLCAFGQAYIYRLIKVVKSSSHFPPTHNFWTFLYLRPTSAQHNFWDSKWKKVKA